MRKTYHLHLINGDCLIEAQSLKPNSVHSIITDPPYGINLMNKPWDLSVPGPEYWEAFMHSLRPGGHLAAFASPRTYHYMATALEAAGFEIRTQAMWIYATGFPTGRRLTDGSHTGLKPGHEPIVIARKPVDQANLDSNVSVWGTAGYQVEHARVNGRWPSTVMISDPAVAIEGLGGNLACFCPKVSKKERGAGLEAFAPKGYSHDNRKRHTESPFQRHKSESPNSHPSVKPSALMSHLIKLLTPPKGVVLDPFMGSGSTGIAAKHDGFSFIGIEKDAEFFRIAKARIAAAKAKNKDCESLKN